MFLTLNERVLADLALLGNLNAQFISEFCKVALDFLLNGAKKGMFKTAAAALQVDVDVVTGAVFAMTEVMLEAARHNLSQQEFSGSLGDVNMSEDSKKFITEFYNTNLRVFRDRIGGGSSTSGAVGGGAGIGIPSTIPEYRNLDWRLEIQVASRYSHDRMQPSYTLRLDTATTPIDSSSSTASSSSSSSTTTTTSPTAANTIPILTDTSNLPNSNIGSSSFIFSSDYQTLKRATESIEEALSELKTAHSRRVLRYIR